MNISAGREVDVKGADSPSTYLSSIMASPFDGYVTVTSEGMYGLEEGLILFGKGRAVAASYIYFAFNREYAAEEAFSRCANAFLNKKALVKAYSLADYQVQLAMTLNEKHAFKSPLTPDKLSMPRAFSPYYEDQAADDGRKEKAPSREEMLKRLHLVMSPKPGFMQGKVEK